jgi:hypothetical protein
MIGVGWFMIYFLSLYFVSDSVILVIRNADSEMIALQYNFPAIISKSDWVNQSSFSLDEKSGYHCKVAASQTGSGPVVVMTHSCLMSYNISLELLYNYCFLHLFDQKSRGRLSSVYFPSTLLDNQSSTVLQSSNDSYQNSESICFRLSFDIDRDDNKLATPVEIFLYVSIDKVFYYTLFLNETQLHHHFLYDFRIPLPHSVIDIFNTVEQYDRVVFRSFDVIILKITSVIFQDGDPLPVQNNDWNTNDIKLKLSNLSVDYLPPS